MAEPLAERAQVNFLGDEVNLVVILGWIRAFAFSVFLDNRGFRLRIVLIDADGGENVRISAILGLRPAIERMLVALGALDAHAEERGGGAFAPDLDGDGGLPAPVEIERVALGVFRRVVTVPRDAGVDRLAADLSANLSVVLPSRLVAVRMPLTIWTYGTFCSKRKRSQSCQSWLRLALRFCCCSSALACRCR